MRTIAALLPLLCSSPEPVRQFRTGKFFLGFDRDDYPATTP